MPLGDRPRRPARGPRPPAGAPGPRTRAGRPRAASSPGRASRRTRPCCAAWPVPAVGSGGRGRCWRTARTTARSRVSCWWSRASSRSTGATADRRTRLFERAGAIGERFGDRDLIALSRLGRGQSLIAQAELARGTACLDEAMVAVIANEVSRTHCGDRLLRGAARMPQHVRCARERRNGRRPSPAGASRSPTSCRIADSAWSTDPRSCSSKGSGRTRSKRRGERAWRSRAIPPSVRRTTNRRRCTACAANTTPPSPPTAARARSDGSRSRAWPCSAWRRATRESAVASIRRVVAEAHGADRSVPGPGGVGRDQLGDRRSRCGARALPTSCATSRPPWTLRCSSPSRATPKVRCWSRKASPAAPLPMLRAALTIWQRLGAPYESAHERALIAVACRQLGDEEAARLEFDQARTMFEALGAAPDVAAIDALVDATASEQAAPRRAHRPRSRGAQARHRRPVESRHRGPARRQRPHRPPPPPEHLRQGGRVLPRRGDRVRVRARARLDADHGARGTNGPRRHRAFGTGGR